MLYRKKTSCPICGKETERTSVNSLDKLPNIKNCFDCNKIYMKKKDIEFKMRNKKEFFYVNSKGKTELVTSFKKDIREVYKRLNIA